MKRQLTEWEKSFANPVSAMELVSETYKELSQLNKKKRNHPILKKQAKDLNGDFSKDMHMVKKHEKKGSSIMNHQGDANQNHTGKYLHTSRMARIQDGQ